MKALNITAMDHIVLNVADVERSLAFYTDVLGLQPERVEEYRARRVGFPSVRISDACVIDLMAAAPEAPAGERRANLNHFCLAAEQTDLEALVASLRQQGVTITQTPVPRWGARGMATSIYFLDPDGNEIEVRCY